MASSPFFRRLLCFTLFCSAVVQVSVGKGRVPVTLESDEWETHRKSTEDFNIIAVLTIT